MDTHQSQITCIFLELHPLHKQVSRSPAAFRKDTPIQAGHLPFFRKDAPIQAGHLLPMWLVSVGTASHLPRNERDGTPTTGHLPKTSATALQLQVTCPKRVQRHSNCRSP